MIYPIQKIIEFENTELEEMMSRVELDITQSGALHSGLNRFLNFTTKNEIPIVGPYVGDIPVDIIQYNKAKHLRGIRQKGMCPHHFVEDKHIEPLLRELTRNIKMLRTMGWTLSPDFSILKGMAQDQKFGNDFRNKFLAALYQKLGIDVIPAPSWCDIKDIERYMEGWPQNSIVAINSTGVCRDKRARHIWLEGYEAMSSILKPTHILRYGGKIKGENTELSTYYLNDNKKGGDHGC